MKHELKQELFEYFNNIQNRTSKEQRLFLQLKGELEFFDIASVSREDISQKGFTADGLSDSNMQRLADGMYYAYLGCGFWDDLTENAIKLKFSEKQSMNQGIWDDAIAMSHYRNRENDMTKPIHDDLLIVNKEMFGDEREHSISFDFYDGYAIGSCGDAPFVLIYPTLYDIRRLPDVERGIRDYTGFKIEPLNFFDSGLKYGMLYKPEQLENK